MPDRRYSEDEIASIFKQAAFEHKLSLGKVAHSQGLTLAEIQEIGKEAGIPSEFIDRAAIEFDRDVVKHPHKKTLGFPVSVGRTINLPGNFTNDDWDALVSDLNDTFHAQGEIRVEGSRRRWNVGNLQVLVEPADRGHRLRLQSLNETKRSTLLMSTIFIGMGIFFTLLIAAKGDFLDLSKIVFAASFGLIGLGIFGYNAFQLPKWCAERSTQMDGLAKRALKRAAANHDTSTHDLIEDQESKAQFVTDIDIPSKPKLDLDAEAEPPHDDIRSGRPRGRSQL